MPAHRTATATTWPSTPAPAAGPRPAPPAMAAPPPAPPPGRLRRTSTSTAMITAAPYRRRDHSSAGKSTCVRPQPRHRPRRGQNSSQPAGTATSRRRACPHGASTPPHDGQRSTPAISRDSTLPEEPRTVTTRCHLRHHPGGPSRSPSQRITGRAAATAYIATVTPSTNPRNANPPDNPERHRQRREPQPPWPPSTARDTWEKGNRVSGVSFSPFFSKIAKMTFLGWKSAGRSRPLGGARTLAMNMARASEDVARAWADTGAWLNRWLSGDDHRARFT